MICFLVLLYLTFVYAGADHAIDKMEQQLSVCIGNLEMHAIGMHTKKQAPNHEMICKICFLWYAGADRDTGEQLLSVCMGNLEMAIGMHMDQEEGARPSGSGTQARPSAGVGIEPGAGAGAAATASVEEELLYVYQDGLLIYFIVIW